MEKINAKNIVRVEVDIPGLVVLAKALTMIAESKTGITGILQEENNAVPPSAAPAAPIAGGSPVVPVVQVPTAPTATVPPVAPMAPGAAPTTVPPAAPATPIPTTAVPAAHTRDELAVAASQLVNMGKQQRLIEILQVFGVNSLMELPQDKYGAFAGCLKAEGVKF